MSWLVRWGGELLIRDHAGKDKKDGIRERATSQLHNLVNPSSTCRSTLTTRVTTKSTTDFTKEYGSAPMSALKNVS